MSFTVVIPARHGASRLPAKPLVDIGGKPMLQWVHERACASAAAQVVVATDDARIAAAAESFGATVRMTRAEHPSGTDRIEEVSRQLELDDSHIVVNVQGDEPLLPATVIDQVAANLAANGDADIATLSAPIRSAEEMFDANVVKVVTDARKRALYFSRAPIPWQRDDFVHQSGAAAVIGGAARRHLGIYAYRVGLLRRFVNWPTQELERVEALEQLRALANGAHILVDLACAEVPAGVDTEADLQRVRRLLAEA